MSPCSCGPDSLLTGEGNSHGDWLIHQGILMYRCGQRTANSADMATPGQNIYNNPDRDYIAQWKHPTASSKGGR